MTALWMSQHGPSSHKELVEYVEAVLKDNTYVPSTINTEEYTRNRIARGIVFSILHRLGGEFNYDTGRWYSE